MRGKDLVGSKKGIYGIFRGKVYFGCVFRDCYFFLGGLGRISIVGGELIGSEFFICCSVLYDIF